MLNLIRDVAHCEDGATAVEYGLIVSLIVIAMIVALTALAGTNANTWNNVSTEFVDASS